MKIIWHNEKRLLSKLIPFESNPRQLTEEQHKQLKLSLEKFNLAEIPVINTDNEICAGHQRIKVLMEIYGGDYEIDVRVPNRKLTEDEFKEYNIRSNKNTGEWDWDALANMFEIEELVDWGFAEAELLGNDAGSQPDELPDVDLDGEVEGNVEWVVIRFQKKPDYENICKLLGMREGARTIDFEEVRSYFPVEEDV